jgi:chromosome segregation ATPase
MVVTITDIIITIVGSGGLTTVLGIVVTNKFNKGKTKAEEAKVHADSYNVISEIYHKLLLDIQGQVSSLRTELALISEREFALKAKVENQEQELQKIRSEKTDLEKRIKILEEENQRLKSLQKS